VPPPPRSRPHKRPQDPLHHLLLFHIRQRMTRL
jgi:hypothetical protein